MGNLRLIPLDAYRINDRQKAGPAALVDMFVIPHDASAGRVPYPPSKRRI
jgi:hypothetical protein